MPGPQWGGLDYLELSFISFPGHLQFPRCSIWDSVSNSYCQFLEISDSPAICFLGFFLLPAGPCYKNRVLFKSLSFRTPTPPKVSMFAFFQNTALIKSEFRAQPQRNHFLLPTRINYFVFLSSSRRYSADVPTPKTPRFYSSLTWLYFSLPLYSLWLDPFHVHQ